MTFSFLGFIVENLWNYKELRCNVFSIYISKLLSLPENICVFPFFPVYGLGGIIIAMVLKLKLNIYGRLLMYVVLFNLIELGTGIFLQKWVCKKTDDSCFLGNRGWNYTDNPNFRGHIDIKHSIYWMIFGLLGESLYLNVLSKDVLPTSSFIAIGFLLYTLVTILHM